MKGVPIAWPRMGRNNKRAVMNRFHTVGAGLCPWLSEPAHVAPDLPQ